MKCMKHHRRDTLEGMSQETSDGSERKVRVAHLHHIQSCEDKSTGLHNPCQRHARMPKIKARTSHGRGPATLLDQLACPFHTQPTHPWSLRHCVRVWYFTNPTKICCRHAQTIRCQADALDRCPSWLASPPPQNLEQSYGADWRRSCAFPQQLVISLA